MRIAFISEGNEGLESMISSRFGRAPHIVVVDVEGDEVKNIKVVPNPGNTASGGAAIKTVQKLINENVETIVAGSYGPNALAALEEVGIKHVQLSGITVREALTKLLQ